MTTYRFRVKLERDPGALWRDVAVGADRTLDEFQSTINDAVGLDRSHLWFFGTDRDYWQSPVAYQRPEEYRAETPDGALGPRPEEYDAGEATLGEVVDDLDVDRGDSICYLYDYGDEWRFYALLKAVDDGPDDRPPEVVGEKGDPVVQYPAPGEGYRYR